MTWEQKIVRSMVVLACFLASSLAMFGAVAAFEAATRSIQGKVTLDVDKAVVASIIKTLQPYDKNNKGGDD